MSSPTITEGYARVQSIAIPGGTGRRLDVTLIESPKPARVVIDHCRGRSNLGTINLDLATFESFLAMGRRMLNPVAQPGRRMVYPVFSTIDDRCQTLCGVFATEETARSYIEACEERAREIDLICMNWSYRAEPILNEGDVIYDSHSPLFPLISPRDLGDFETAIKS